MEERLADKLSTERAGASAARTRALAVLRRLGSYDRAVYRSVARLSTPLLDEPLRRVSGFANHSKPWFITAGVPLSTVIYARAIGARWGLARTGSLSAR